MKFLFFCGFCCSSACFSDFAPSSTYRQRLPTVSIECTHPMFCILVLNLLCWLVPLTLCRHLGQRDIFLPTNHGFDSYFGIPYSVDMGSSAWMPSHDIPLPLMNGTEIIEQPVDLDRLTERYLNEATRVIKSSTESNEPFFLCTCQAVKGECETCDLVNLA